MTINKRSMFFLTALGFISLAKPEFALAEDSPQEVQLQKLLAQTKALESQMQLLKSEVRRLKVQQHSVKKSVHNNSAVPLSHSSFTTTSISSDTHEGLSSSPIVISSYLGPHTAFDSSDLITNYASYNESLHLLQLKQKVYQKRAANTNPESVSLPFLMISGKVEGLASYQRPSDDVSNSSIDLSDAELDITPVLNEWASGFMAFQYNSGNELATPPRVLNNSRVHINKAFLTFGNLDVYPVYFTMGQFNIPFGKFSSSMISSPLTQNVFQTRARAILLGYAQPDEKGFYAQAYAFNGDTYTNRRNSINSIGANAGYIFQNEHWHTDAGIGAINNIADSFGMQQTNAPGFGGFSVTPYNLDADIFSSERLAHQVAGLDAHFSVGSGPFSLVTEYLAATKKFDEDDLAYNQRGAQPKALNIEGNYSFHLFDRPAAVSAGYGQTWELLALSLPETRYIAAFTTSIWKNTIEEIEFRHDKNYGGSTTASGLGIPVNSLGGSSNTVTAQIGIYF